MADRGIGENAVISSIPTPRSPPAGLRRDSGRAWLACVGAAIANGVAFGIVYTFGAFFDEIRAEFDAGSGPTALIFGLTLLGFFGFGAASGAWFDRVGPRPLLAAGGALFVASLLATASVDRIEAAYLTVGLGMGLGGGLFVAPLTAVIGGLFDRQRVTALGVVATGNGLGTLVLVPLADALISDHGWRTAYRWLAVIAAAAFVFGLATVPRPPARSGPAPLRIRNVEIARDPVFRRVFVVSMLFGIGLYIAFGFVIPFAERNGVDGGTAARTLGLVGLASIVGRLGLTGLARRLGAIRVFRSALAAMVVAFALWAVAGGDVALLTVFAVVLGVAYGGFVAIAPEVMLVLFPRWPPGRVLGLMFLSVGVGGLIGPPLAGVLDAAGWAEAAVIAVPLALVLVAIVVARGLTEPDPTTD